MQISYYKWSNLLPLWSDAARQKTLQLCHKDSILSTPNTLFTLTHHRPFTVHYWLLAVPYGGVSSQVSIVVGSLHPGQALASYWHPWRGEEGGRGRPGAGCNHGHVVIQSKIDSPYKVPLYARWRGPSCQGWRIDKRQCFVQHVHCQLWLSLPSQV